MNISTVVLMAALLVAARITWRRGAHAMSVGCAAAAALPALTLIQRAPTWLLIVGAVVGTGLVWQHRTRTASTVTRWGAASRRKSGVASSVDIARAGGTVAMRRRTPTVRPSLRTASRWARLVQLLRQPAGEVAVLLCHVGSLRLWASVEDVVLQFGGPRVGKTQALAGQVIDAPGAVLVTSTRTDVLDQTAPLRAERGPVYVFNPVGLGDRPSTITFDPLTGCTDPVTANERAADMLATAGRSGSGDREYWNDQGRHNLAALMHAAALGGLTMAHVQDWLSNLDAHETRILKLLRDHSPEPAFEAAVAGFIATNPNTRTSITSTIAPALGWRTHPPALAAALPIAEGGHPFDVAELLAGNATVYMLGGEEAQVAPLVCALTGYIAREARRLAAFRPGGRLDPPLSLRLDEAALICPVPLHQWTSDMGGRGVSIVANFQSRAQLVARYGLDNAAVILNNSGARVLHGGTVDRDDLNFWSTLAGERDEPTTTTDLHGRVASRTVRRVPVLAAAQLANLPAGKVVVFRRDMPPVIGRAQRAWRRHDVRAVHQPGALTVRTRVLAVRWWGVVVGWLRPAGAWLLRPLAQAGARLQALRWRLTGTGPTTGYVPFDAPPRPISGPGRRRAPLVLLAPPEDEPASRNGAHAREQDGTP